MNETEKTIAAFKELGVTEFTTQRMPHADYVGQEYLNEDEGKLYPKKPRHTTGGEILDLHSFPTRRSSDLQLCSLQILGTSFSYTRL